MSVDLRPVEERLAWRNAVAGTVLILTGELAFLGLGWSLFGTTPVFWMRVAHLLLATLVLSGLLVGARRVSARVATWSIGLLVVLLLPVSWVAESEMIVAGRPWAPFMGHRLVMLGLAALMPGPVGWGALLVAVYATAALLQFYAFGIAEHVGIINAGEPWLTLIYAAVALSLLLIRWRHRRVAGELAHKIHEAEALRAYTSVLLALRDLSNTPIQTLEIDTAILERRHPEDHTATRRMRAAVGRLRELSQLLADTGPPSPWTIEGTSFDPREVLRRAGAARLAGPGGEPSPDGTMASPPGGR